MQSVALGVREVVTFVVCNEIDNGPLWESGRLVENKPPFLDAGSERTHLPNVRLPRVRGKRSRCATKAHGTRLTSRWHRPPVFRHRPFATRCSFLEVLCLLDHPFSASAEATSARPRLAHTLTL